MQLSYDEKPNRFGSAWKRTTIVLAGIVVFGSPALSLPATPTHSEGPPTAQQLEHAHAAVSAQPSSSPAHFALAELLRRSGRNQEAAKEYLQAGLLDPSNYVAFHNLSLCDAEHAQLDEGIASLTKLQAEKPSELMLRVALSELLEKRGNYYQAARVLVDLVYRNAVPERFTKKVNARIHYLLAKSKEAHQGKDKNFVSDEDIEATPLPLPEASLKKDLTASKIKEPKAMRSVGHTPLLP